MTPLEFGVIDVGPLDPALLVALATCSVIAWLAGRIVGHFVPEVGIPWLRRPSIAAACVVIGIAVTVATVALFEALYRSIHNVSDNVMVAVFVWPLIFVPAALLIISTARTLKRRSRDQAVA